MSSAAAADPAGFVIAVATYFALYFVWLMFLSWLVSRVVGDGKPVTRAALCVVIAVAIAWAFHFALHAMDLDVIVVTRGFFWVAVAIEFCAPLAVFLWEWWSFQRHWTDDDDIEEIFE